MIDNSEIAAQLRKIADEIDAADHQFHASENNIQDEPLWRTRSLRVELMPNASEATAVQIEFRERVKRTDAELEPYKR